MTYNTDSTPKLEKSSRKIVVTRQEQLERLVQAVNYVYEHNIIATRANLASVAKKFWPVTPALLSQAIRVATEENLRKD